MGRVSSPAALLAAVVVTTPSWAQSVEGQGWYMHSD
jgi:hypothetical protein